jgi:predicted CxxxxCH...CXXCH cytochrome family protein
VNLNVRRTSPLAALAILLLAAGCATSRSDDSTARPACQTCHGGTSGNAAPPITTTGQTAATAIGVGAHQSHLQDTFIRQAVACDECHVVPESGTAHANGVVELAFGTLATHGGAAATYDRASATCSNVYCHGETLGAGGVDHRPIWNGVNQGLGCNACHGDPPPNHRADATDCNACHPLTVKANGGIDVAGGHHINGQVEAVSHADFTAPATHGPQFFQFLAGTSTLDCTACHGTTYDGGTGPSCNACHAAAGWTASWQTNCSFCHGTKNDFTKTTPYTVTNQPTLAAPPDALSQRLDGVAVPERTGAHQAHVTGTGSTSGSVYAAPVPCASCHAVPADFAHAGGPGRAPVVLTGSGTLPADLGTYSPTTLTCATYCHGSTLVDDLGHTAAPPVWTGAELGCGGCHGNPPASGQHAFHVTTVHVTCTNCHNGTVSPSGAIGPSHLDGLTDVKFPTATIATWDGTNNCTSLCHTDNGLRPWR